MLCPASHARNVAIQPADLARLHTVARAAIPQLPVLIATEREQVAILQQHKRVLVATGDTLDRLAVQTRHKARDKDVTAVAVPEAAKVAPAAAWWLEKTQRNILRRSRPCCEQIRGRHV